MQGLAIGVLQSTSMSLLGRVYSPGIRKTRVFSVMSAMTPVGFLVGCLQGSALTTHLPWIFGSNAIVCFICAVASIPGIPSFSPKPAASGSQLSLKDFDALGAFLAAIGCGLVILGLTQRAPAAGAHTHTHHRRGILSLPVLHLAEQRASRPLVDNRLWTTPGFSPTGDFLFPRIRSIRRWMDVLRRAFPSHNPGPRSHHRCSILLSPT